MFVAEVVVCCLPLRNPLAPFGVVPLGQACSYDDQVALELFRAVELPVVYVDACNSLVFVEVHIGVAVSIAKEACLLNLNPLKFMLAH